MRKEIKKLIRWLKKLSGAGKLFGRAQAGQNFEKNPKTVAQCRKYPIPYLYTLSQTIPYL